MRHILILIMFMAWIPYASSQKLLSPTEGIYHGSFPDMGPTEDVVTIERIKEFENLTGKETAWVYFSDNWFDGIKYPRGETEAIRDAGSVPFIRMMPRSDWDGYKQDPNYSMQNIIDGKYDLELHQYARDAKGYGSPLLIEFGTEVNGDWFPWNGAYNGGGQKDGYGDPEKPDGSERFVAAYRHIIDIFRKEQADNVTWFYHVNATTYPEDYWNRMKAYYPGDEYIDWIGVSVYGPQTPSDGWKTFTDVMDDNYRELEEITPNKPIALVEFGTIDPGEGHSKAEWIDNALTSITSNRYPRIKAISYWHSKWENDGVVSNMRLDSTPESIKTYRELINSPIFLPELYFSK